MAYKITVFFVEQGLIENEVRLVFQTGFDVLLSTVIQAAVIILLGTVMENTIEAVFFLICFYSLRQYGGGFHAKSRLTCLGVMAATWLYVALGTWVLGKVGQQLQQLITAGMALISAVIYLRFAPVHNPAKVFAVDREKTNRKKAVMIFGFWLIVILILYIGKWMGNRISLTIVCTIWAEALLMLPVKGWSRA